MKNMLKVFANINILLGALLLITPIGFLLYYVIFPGSKVEAQYDPEKENNIIVKPIFNENNKPKRSNYNFKDPFGSGSSSESLIKPLEFTVPADSVADIGTRIRIPVLGLDTIVYETQSPSKGLSAGVWRDPYYGVPDKVTSGPMVLAAHRWGEDWFSWEYRFRNLFTKFDQLKGGEEVIITWNGREYRYIVRYAQQGTTVTDTADLIMYTCVYYNSPERIFVYADLVR